MRAKEVLISVFIIVATMLMILAVGYSAPQTFETGYPTTVATTSIYGASGTLNAMQQQQNARNNGLNLSISEFSCNATSYCQKVPIAACDNNLPDQSACINSADYGMYLRQYNASVHPTPCPLYIAAGNITCSCDLSANTCAEHYSP